ncbi:MAG: hypothetical protein HY909_20445 [Deltaproteobacteria bacterium]|nr:hypothetical protein [Deltaproteobacteria bacterium]
MVAQPGMVVVDQPMRQRASITFSPIHLILPMFEVTGEFALRPRVSVAGILGLGAIKVSGETFGIFEIGAQGRFYVLGDFTHGLNLGVELLYLGISNAGSSSGFLANGAGLSLGPLLGYKLATRVGFTLDIQGGAAFVVAGARASGGGTTATASQSQIIPVLNLNLGWSF